jgi:predicted phage-related endonuclease
MLYTPDGLVPGQRRGVDAKVVAWDQRRKWGETAAEIPERIQLQCWWYMACMEYDAWDVVALIGDTPRVYEITRDREAERAMIERAEEWYRRYIVGDEMPEMGASEAAAQWLQRTFPTHKRPDLRFATTEEVALLTEYAEVRIAMAGLQRRKDELENAIKLAIAEKEGLVWETGKFTWRRSKDSQVTDWESLALALLTHHIKDEAERERVLDSYTRTKPGTRRIRFEHDLMRSDDAAA